MPRRRPGFDVAGECIEQHGQGRIGAEQHQQPCLRTERSAAERGRRRGGAREAIGLGTCRVGEERDDGTHGVLYRWPWGRLRAILGKCIVRNKIREPHLGAAVAMMSLRNTVVRLFTPPAIVLIRAASKAVTTRPGMGAGSVELIKYPIS